MIKKGSLYFKILFFSLCIFSISLFGMIYYVEQNLPKSYKVTEGEGLLLNCNLPIKVSSSDSKNATKTTENNKFTAKLKLFGVVPAGDISVEVVDELYVYVVGETFGIKIYTEGVLVVGFSDVDAAEGSVNPAKEAGIKAGDFIVSLNGVKVYTNEDVAAIIKSSEGEKISAKIVRDGKEKQVIIVPKLSASSNLYRAGVWVKDSSAGIGTLTFYSPTTNVICGLGHGICDSETETLLTLEQGEFVSAEVVAIEKGTSGKPGQLKGRFSGKSISEFNLNSNNGVYGKLTSEIQIGNLTKIALKQEIKEGNAQIYTTIDETGPRAFDCKIKINGKKDSQNLIVEVTDEELLSITGGIVQGMSGSPIIQNGKLIGAVTHVLVDDPTKGYGIFAEKMLETAQGIAEKEKLREVS